MQCIILILMIAWIYNMQGDLHAITSYYAWMIMATPAMYGFKYVSMPGNDHLRMH